MDWGLGIGSALQGIAGIGQIIQGGIWNKQAKREINQLRAAAPSLSTPSEYYEMAKLALDDRLMQRGFDEINRSLATQTQSLQNLGGRAAILGANRLVEGANIAKERFNLAENEQRIAATQQLAGARERETDRRNNRWMFEMDAAQRARNAAVQQLQSGFSTLGKAGTGAAMAAGDEFWGSALGAKRDYETQVNLASKPLPRLF
jgi:hypothetical protein